MRVQERRARFRMTRSTAIQEILTELNGGPFAVAFGAFTGRIPPCASLP
jgi:hypothetical protein